MPRLRLAIVKRNEDVKGFVVLPRRWVVERTFSWFGRNRRLAKDFENLAETRNPSHLRYPRLYPACPQAARQGVGRGSRYTMAKVGKSGCEGTFARASGNDEVAPKPAVRVKPILIGRVRPIAAIRCRTDVISLACRFYRGQHVIVKDDLPIDKGNA